ncbi:uncharacterized protein GIQ15_05579 [Arthroderma uncinatum]|uniref:uncharacterized protein n=1 Tax=Arthroderma uncinatum TaxID=74035 RepID=UPI00144AD591|nr:uncharacterized protein GIQ15_05579 [Arthroderma uncinatum]KAF3480232.1 hypothetical protein GIQ15_05579 [Arthroderma uncinatum]
MSPPDIQVSPSGDVGETSTNLIETKEPRNDPASVKPSGEATSKDDQSTPDATGDNSIVDNMDSSKGEDVTAEASNGGEPPSSMEEKDKPTSSEPPKQLTLQSKRGNPGQLLQVDTQRDQPPLPPKKDEPYLDPTPKTPQAPRSPTDKDLPEVPQDDLLSGSSSTKAKAESEERKSEDSQSEIQTIMGQFSDEISSLRQEEIMSPRLELAEQFRTGQGHFPPRKSSLEQPAKAEEEPADVQAASVLPSTSSSNRHSLSPPAVPPKSPPSANPGKPATVEKTDSHHAPSTPNSAVPPPPEPEAEQPFDFHRFLEQLRHRTADPVAKFLRSFLTEFGKRQWMVHEQVKIISDFLAFITNKMAQCDVWKGVSDVEFDNAKEGMEKLVMNRLYTQTFSPTIPPPTPSRSRSRGRRKEIERMHNPGRRGQHQEDVERDEILAQKVRIYSWVREEHLDIPPVGPNGRRFLLLAQQELLKIKGYRAPRDKVICILNCCKVIFGLLRNAKSSDTSADSFIPLLIYVVLKANPEHLVSNVQYILRFRNQDKLSGEAGYYLSSLSGAIQFIETLDRTSLTVSDEEFERNVEAAVSAIAERNPEPEDPPSVPEKPSNSKSREPTPRVSVETGSNSRHKESSPSHSPVTDDNTPVAGLLRTIQKPLTTIGRIFSDDTEYQRERSPFNSQHNSSASENVAYPAQRSDSDSWRGQERSRGRDGTSPQPATRFDAQEAAARQASAESAEARRIQRAEHNDVVETLSGMFPNLDRDIIDDVVSMKEGRNRSWAIKDGRPLAFVLHSVVMTRRKKTVESKGESAANVPATSSHQEQKPQGSSAYPKAVKTTPAEPSTSALIISRNKHWRYISSFHGPWLQLPPEILESLANSNYASPQPQPIDPAVFFDLIKIRQLIEEATDLAVRAVNGTTSPPGSNSFNSSYGLMGSGGGSMGSSMRGSRGDGTTKLSRERRHRMREHASQKLSKAYALDEIAASVATMQSASALEQVAKLVLQRNEHDCDAKYVHFFHEKIPSRSLVQCTSLQPLDDIIAIRQLDGAVYRTRAVAKMLKDDLVGAARDLTDGLAACRACARQHDDGKKEVELASESTKRKSTPSRYNPKIEEKDQPRGLESQLLFHRAGVYLSIATQHIHEALSAWEKSKEVRDSTNGDGPKEVIENGEGPIEKQAHRRWLEARKIVKTNARRALRDYLAFLSLIPYTPGPSPETMADGTVTTVYKVHQVSALFSSQPPADLPPYPEESEALTLKGQRPRTPTVCHEAVTYHPLLTDALHSVLICHSILQTPEKEFLRHAHMVARVARICDGYPIFLAPRSPSRSDWMEILHRTDNWLKLKQPWEILCAPAPLPGHPTAYKKGSPESIAAAAEAAGRELALETGQKEFLDEKPVHTNHITNAVFKRWAQEDAKGFPFCSERAEAVSWWIRMAPVSAGTGRNRGKKSVGNGKEEADNEQKQGLADDKEADISVQDLAID